MRTLRSQRRPVPKEPRLNRRKPSESSQGLSHGQCRSRRRWSRLKKAARVAAWLVMAGIGTVGVAIASREAGPVVNSWFTIREVTVQGLEHVTRREIIDRLALSHEATLVSVAPDRLAERVAGHPWVKSARVARVPFHELRVEIIERKPAAIVRASSGNVLVDDGGAVLARIGTNDDPTLPAMTGVDPDGLARGEARGREVVKTGVELAKLVTQTLDGRVEVDVTKDDSLVAAVKGIRFQVGASAVDEQWERFRKMKPALRASALNGTGKAAHEIDLRFADRVIVRERG